MLPFLVFLFTLVSAFDTLSSTMNLRGTRYAESSINKNNADELTLDWVTTIPGNVLSTPAKYNGVIYTGDHIGYFTAVNDADGSIRWQKNVSRDYNLPNMTYLRTTPLIIPEYNLIVMPTSGRWGAPTSANIGPDWGTSEGCWLLGINLHDGSLRYKELISDFYRAFVTGSPTYETATGFVYLGLSSNEEMEDLVSQRLGRNFTGYHFVGKTMAYHAVNGSKIWEFPTIPLHMVGPDKYSGAAVWSSGPTIWGDYVYFSTGNLYNIPQETKDCYILNPNNASCVPPEVLFDAVIKQNKYTGVLVASQRVTEQDAWNIMCRLSGRPGCPLPPGMEGPDADFANNAMLTQPDVHGDVFIPIGQKSGIFYYMNATDLSIIWEKAPVPTGAFGGFQYGSSMNPDGQIFASHANSMNINYTTFNGDIINYGSILRFAADGKIKWEVPSPTRDGVPGSITSTNNVLMVPTRSGRLLVLSAVDGKILWFYNTNTPSMAGPAVDGRCVYWPTGYTINFSTGARPQPTKLYKFCLPNH